MGGRNLFSAPAGRAQAQPGAAARRRNAGLAAALALALAAAFGTGRAAAQAQQSGAPAAAGAAAAADGRAIGPSGLPLPRFVTIKSNHANMRIGPDQGKYPISWTYQQRGLPVEIFQEYGNWRRIRDVDGTEGWVNAALLSGKRGAIISPKGSGLLPLYREPSTAAQVVIKAEAGVIAAVENCSGVWCELRVQGHRGYIQQNKLWGVYPHEAFKD